LKARVQTQGLWSKRRMYVAASDAVSTTDIPLKQVRRVVEAYSFWVADGGRRRDHETRRESGMEIGRMLTAAQLAVWKEWDKLAEILLHDLEDLHHGGA
jgi:hypothetical protein